MNTEDKCSITGDNLGCRECCHKSDKCLILRDRTFIYHLFYLHACSDAADISSLISLTLKCVVVGGNSHIGHIHIGCLTELDIRILGSKLHYYLTVSVEKYYIAALLSQFPERLFHLIIQHITACIDLDLLSVFFLKSILGK